MRRHLASTDALLVMTVLIWSLNITVTKYIITHGVAPLSYAAVRYAFASVIFVAITLVLERSLRIGGRRAHGQVAVAAVSLLLNQMCFVYALKLTTATTVALLLGTMPVFAGLLGWLTGLERMTRRFWLAAGVSAAGVALVALGSGGDVSGHLTGILAALGMAATWSVYSVAIAPLMRTYSPFRISAVVLPLAWIGLALAGSAQLAGQDVHVNWLVWLGLVFAVVGPLVLTNVFWFTAVHRVGPSHATLVANLQPFVAAVIAVILLSEPLSPLQIAGGILIAAGILLAGRRSTAAAPAE